MNDLSKLSNSHRPRKKGFRVGRGMGSKCGKTCGRGSKGDKARRGYKNHFGQEGGQIPLYKKLPTRGFTNGRFKNENFAINLNRIDQYFSDGDLVTLETLQEKGIAPRRVPGGLKILADGELTKKVVIKARFFSLQAGEKLKKQGIPFEVLA
jgi:large subunit ribosomal protein L15